MQGAQAASLALLTELEGRWRLTREIEDRRTGETGRLEGEASFSRDASGLIYRETGRLELPGRAPMSAEQTYLWRAEGEEIAVFFGNGRTFHRFRAGQTQASAGHDCAPDRYDVRYDFALPERWAAVWEVRGPRKDYRMESRYLRV